MTRKGLWVGFSYLAGLLLACVGWGENNYIFFLAAVGLGLIGFFSLKDKRVYVVVCTVSFLAGIIVNSVYTHFVYEKLIVLDGEIVTIDGYIEDYSYVGSDTSLVTVRGKINGIKTTVSFFVPDNDYGYYDRISVTGKVTKISDSINFTSEKYYRPKGIFLQGSTAENAVLYGSNANPFFRAVKNYRDHLLSRIYDIVGGQEGAFLSAMLCGDKSEMPQSMKTTLYRSGIGHIFAVSGTHLVIITALFGVVLAKLVNSRRLKFWLTMAEVWGFVVFAGLSVSVVRAAIMLTIMRCGFFFGRKGDCGNSLGLCAVILTAANPYIAADVSFLMSFSAAFAIGEIAPVISEKLNMKSGIKLKSAAVSAVTVLLFTAPLSVYFFGGISAVSVLSNIVIVPLCTLSLQISFLSVLTGGIGFVAVPALTVAKYPVKLALYLAQLFCEIPYAYVTASDKIIGGLIALTCFVPLVYGIFFANSGKFCTVTVSVFLLWFAAGNIFSLIDNGIKIFVLPNGPSAEYVLCDGQSAVVFDIGCMGKLNSGVETVLENNGIRYLDGLFISEGEIYTLNKAENDLSLKPELVLSNSYAEFGGFSVLCITDGYCVTADDNEFFLYADGFSFNGMTFDTSSEKYPLEINLDNLQVRRLDYGFD